VEAIPATDDMPKNMSVQIITSNEEDGLDGSAIWFFLVIFRFLSVFSTVN
jgi:hypothetical protein